MTFLVFQRSLVDGKSVIRHSGGGFRLAGYNLIHQAWQAHGSPTDQGWHVTADELIRLHTNNTHDYETMRLIIDFDPNATSRIGLIELLGVYAFTWSDGYGGPSWTPMMLRLRDAFYEEYDLPIDSPGKAAILTELPEPGPNSPEFVQFRFLHGPRDGWNWRTNGISYAVDLYGMARDYFRQFF